MSEVTLMVPAEYADDFRAACVHELRVEAGYVKDERKKFLLAKWEERDNADDTDLRSAQAMLAGDVELSAQVGPHDTGEITIRMEDEHGLVAHVCETMARDVVGPHLKDALGVGPIDSDYCPTSRVTGSPRSPWRRSTATAARRNASGTR